MHDDLYSLEIEQYCISGIIKYPEIFSDIDGFIIDDDFYQNTHKNIYSIIKQNLIKNKKINNVLIAQELIHLKIKSELPILDYLDSLSYKQITKDAAIENFKELSKLRVCRELFQNSNKEQEFILKNKNLKLEEIIAGVDGIHNEKINTLEILSEPLDLYAGIPELIEETGNNPKEEIGLVTPYKCFNSMFGGIRFGAGVYSCTSRPKIGKSSWLLNMAEGCVRLNTGCKVLYLDTEMSLMVNQFRAASAITDVPMWYLESGQWKKYENYRQQIAGKIKETKKHLGKIFHLRVASKPIEEICSIIRRWVYKNIRDGDMPFVIYDYIKLTGEKLSNHWSEHQAIGEKINRLNEIQANLNLGMFVAMQQNRSAEYGIDDSSAVALSDRLQWFCAFNGIFRRKTLEEIEEYGSEFGTHLLKPLAQRFQGKEGSGHQDYINVSLDKKKPKYKQNFINFDVKNFRIKELGTLRDIVEKQKEKIDIQDGELESAGDTL